MNVKPDPRQMDLLKRIPGVDAMLELTSRRPEAADIPRSVQVDAARRVAAGLREKILSPNGNITESDLAPEAVLVPMLEACRVALAPKLRGVVNATGVVVHTNLGRSLLAPEAIERVQTIAAGYSNLEFDLAAGRRGSRYTAVEGLLCELSGARSALVVNNNAGAVLLCLNTLCREKEALVSRGELVEIGGSFRIPDVMTKSGARLKEIGTTNRTHPRDYSEGIGSQTGLLLKVHTSNYHVVGFTASVALEELVAIGKERGIPVMEDLGSGTFVDFSRYGLAKEPTVQESVAAGADVITFSGDKLLGGPQAGIIVGKTEYIDRIKQNPMTRALRIDKLTLAALESTLALYRDEARAIATIPTLRMLTTPVQALEKPARTLCNRLEALAPGKIKTRILNRAARAGGGALPLLEIPSLCVALEIQEVSANSLETFLRKHRYPVIGRIEADGFLLDMRTMQTGDIETVVSAVESLLAQKGLAT